VFCAGIRNPILVLDNVPWAFCDPSKCSSAGSNSGGDATYGMNHGPFHVQEFASWIESLLRAMVARYGEARASSFWFRVGTEPNTRPGHWNDTNAKYVDEYIAVSTAVRRILPRALVGLANMGADGSSWETRVMPMAQGIVDAQAPVDFIAMSCYGRGTHHMPLPYGIASAALCSERLQRMRSLGGARWAQLPAQSMEYGLQQNALGLVDESPGVFAAAWMLATSVAIARNSVERAFQWPAMIDVAFSHDDGPCSPKVSATPCSLYGGTVWVRAQAGLLFGSEDPSSSSSSSAAAAGTTFVLEALTPGSNATTVAAIDNQLPAADAAAAAAGGSGRRKTKTITSADGIGGWSQSGDELRLLLTAFSPSAKTHDLEPATVQVTVERPARWPQSQQQQQQQQGGGGGGGLHRMQMRTATLNRSTSTFDTILHDAQRQHPDWLTNATDPNVYPLSLARNPMLTKPGRAALVQQQGPAYLAMQRRTFAASEWRDVPGTTAPSSSESESSSGSAEEGESVVCGAHTCTVTRRMATPSVLAV
jgi:hypothetical protein